MADINMLICTRGDPDAEVTEGSTLDVCARCGQSVWVSVSGRGIIRDQGSVIMCMDCGVPMMDEPPMPPTPEQIAEFGRWLEGWQG